MMLTPRAFLYSRQQQVPASPNPSTTSTSPTSSLLKRRDEQLLKKSAGDTRSSNADIATRPTSAMPKRKESGHLTPPSRSPPSTTMTSVHARPITPTSAVEIPVKHKKELTYTHKSRHYADSSRRSSASSQHRRDRHCQDVVPPAVAALLAVTSIPPPHRRGSLRQRMTVDSIVPRSQVSEKELSQELSFSPFSRSPMDVLLSPPDESLDEDASVISDSGFTSALSTRAGSLESLPSLGDSLGTSTLPSVDGPLTPRGRRFRPPRRSLEPVSSPPGEQAEHPLWEDPNEMDELAFEPFTPSPIEKDAKPFAPSMPIGLTFKSNLTASLRALRSAARSLSALTASSVPPEDLLTRSILTIDPRVPFTDERRPPVLEEEPSEAMRRYLNPTDGARLDHRPTTVPATRSYTASIQMQTYKVQRSRNAPASASRSGTPPPPSPPKPPVPLAFPPGPRQREIRENSDFIRIAVLEHLMRKCGKFDSQQEGHARWLLPPRKQNAKPYEVGTDGVPIRWVSVNQD
ncbi:hypothetical protein BX600DRAFT_218877 [Xylariales sp. PMI_506]|nr:hypothetical protein BX600DRAFT_218877 [Xylariales sp. PMI_506]